MDELSRIRERVQGTNIDAQTLQIHHQGELFTVTLEAPAPAPAAPLPPSPVTPATQQAAQPASAPASAAAPAPPATGSPADPGAVTAPMTGTIREVRVTPGQAVDAGQVVVVMEAMKMDIDIVAPIAGRLAEIAVRDGQSVVEAQVVARISSDQ